MIDWSKVDKKSGIAWTNLADQLIAKGQFHVVTTPINAAGVADVVEDMSEFVTRATLTCPVEAIEAVRRASTQLAQVTVIAAIADLELRSAKLDGLAARLSSASNELKANAMWLRLEPVQAAVGLASTVVGQLKELESNVAGLSKNDIGGRAGEIVKSVETLLEKLKSSLA